MCLELLPHTHIHVQIFSLEMQFSLSLIVSCVLSFLLHQSLFSLLFLQDFGAHVSDPFAASSPVALEVMNILKLFIQMHPIPTEVGRSIFCILVACG